MVSSFPTLSPRFFELLTTLPRQKIAVVGHARPDGDCIGSQVALARVLRSRGHEVVCVNGDVVPRRLQFLVQDLTFVGADGVPAGDVLSFFVDCADHARAGEKIKARFPRPYANLDHHLSNIGYADHNFVEANASATCEILAGLFVDNGLPIDPFTAQALFAGIMTDTGQFRFNSTSERTFQLSAALVGFGAKPSTVGEEIYEHESLGKIKLLQHFLSSLRLECDGRVCIGLLPNGIFEATGSSPEDTEGLVDYARSIEGVDIGVLVEERPGGIKASLRCKNTVFRVDQIAVQFGGGGHACAAGLNLKNVSEPEFRSRLLAAVRVRLDEINALSFSANGRTS